LVEEGDENAAGSVEEPKRIDRDIGLGDKSDAKAHHQLYTTPRFSQAAGGASWQQLRRRAGSGVVSQGSKQAAAY